MVVLSAALLAHAYMGFSTRYFSDDWCTAGLLKSKGFFGTQRYNYLTVNGRYAARFTQSVAAVVGPGLTPFSPFIALALLLAATMWTLSRLLPTIRAAHPWMTSLLLGELIIFATLDSTPDMFQSFYWQIAMVTYVAPLVLMTTCVGLVVQYCAQSSRTRVPAFWLVLSAVLAFLAGGFSETNLAVHIAALLLAIVACVALAPSRARPGLTSILGAGLVGSLLALAAIAAAPGTNVRLANQFPGQHPQLSTFLVGIALVLSVRFVGEAVVGAKLTMLLVVSLPIVWAVVTELARPGGESAPTEAPTYRSELRTLVFLPIVGFFLILSSIFPAVSVGRSLPPGRALVVAEFVFVAGTICWSYLVGRALSRTRLLRSKMQSPYLILGSSLVIGLLVLSPIRHTDGHLRGHLSLGSELRAYSAMWDRRDREIRTTSLRGETDLTVPTLDSARFSDITPDPQFYANRCMAWYYGVKSIQTHPVALPRMMLGPARITDR